MQRDDVTVVTGAPGSGKTSLVAEKMSPGDLVLDWDHLCYAMGSQVDHHVDEHPEPIRVMATKVWALIWRDILRWTPPRDYHSWIIHAEPTEWQYGVYESKGVRRIHCELV